MVLLTWDGGEEEAGPFDDEVDAVDMARRASEDVRLPSKFVFMTCRGGHADQLRSAA